MMLRGYDPDSPMNLSRGTAGNLQIVMPAINRRCPYFDGGLTRRGAAGNLQIVISAINRRVPTITAILIMVFLYQAQRTFCF